MEYLLHAYAVVGVIGLASFQFALINLESQPHYKAELFESVTMCSDDCPEYSLEIYQDKHDGFQVEHSKPVQDLNIAIIYFQGYRANAPHRPIVLTAHPKAKAGRSFDFLKILRTHEPNSAIFYRVSKYRIPNFRPINPYGYASRTLPERHVRVHVLPNRNVQIEGINVPFLHLEKALYYLSDQFFVRTIHLKIYEGANGYNRLSAERICETYNDAFYTYLNLSCEIEYVANPN